MDRLVHAIFFLSGLGFLLSGRALRDGMGQGLLVQTVGKQVLQGQGGNSQRLLLEKHDQVEHKENSLQGVQRLLWLVALIAQARGTM